MQLICAHLFFRQHCSTASAGPAPPWYFALGVFMEQSYPPQLLSRQATQAKLFQPPPASLAPRSLPRPSKAFSAPVLAGIKFSCIWETRRVHGFPADYLLTALTVPYLCGNAWLETVRIAFAVCTLLHRHALRKAGLGFFFFFSFFCSFCLGSLQA